MNCPNSTIRRRYLLAAMALVGGLATGASAEVHVEGNVNALRVTASGDKISDVLSAFGAQFPLKYRTGVPLDAEVTGSFSGSLSRVVSRLLDGYNYVIKKDKDLTEIVVFSERGEAPVSPKTPPAKGALSRWR